MRYELKVEVVKHGSKTEKYFCVFDHTLNRIVARYATEKKAEEVLARLTTATRTV